MLRRGALPGALTLLTALSCGPKTAGPPARVFSRSRTAPDAGVLRQPVVRSHRGEANPPPVDVATECTPAMRTAIDRLRHGRTLHFGPVCSPMYTDEWVALAVTGTTQEASDVWVVLGSGDRVETHRVRRAPVGVQYTAATIANGFAYLVGQSIATDEMPAGADALVTFAIPRPGEPDPEALDLAPPDVPLLGARDRADLLNRLRSVTVAAEPTPSAAEETVRRILGVGPRGLITSLPSDRGVPMLRAWEVGVYERTGMMHAQLDPANARLAAAVELLRTVEPTMDCGAGDRCVARARPSATEVYDAVMPSGVLLRRDGPNTVVAAVIEQGRRPSALAEPNADRMGNPVYDNADDRALLESLALGGAIVGRVTGVARGPARLLAADIARGDAHEAVVYVQFAQRAPRRFEDTTFAHLARGQREVHFRDIEHNNEPELMQLAHLSSGEDAVGLSTVLWPPAVVERGTYARYDLTRTALGAHTVAEADRALRSFAPFQMEQEPTCQLIDRATAETPRNIASDTPGAFEIIDYTEPREPLHGTPRRVTVAQMRHMADANEVLGPFANTHCADLLCDWFQGYCRKSADGREVGYLWFTGRRGTPLWGMSVLNSGSSDTAGASAGGDGGAMDASVGDGGR